MSHLRLAERRCNTEFNDLRKFICLKKYEVSVETITVCSVIENLAEHGIYCLPCFCISIIPYFLGYKTDFFPSKNDPKDLDPSYKTDLDL